MKITFSNQSIPVFPALPFFFFSLFLIKGLVKLEEALATFIASNPSKISIAGLIINDLPTNYGPVEGISPISWKETIGNSLVSIAESIQLFVPLVTKV